MKTPRTVIELQIANDCLEEKIKAFASLDLKSANVLVALRKQNLSGHSLRMAAARHFGSNLPPEIKAIIG